MVDEQFVHYCLILGDVDNMSLYLKKNQQTLDVCHCGWTIRPLLPDCWWCGQHVPVLNKKKKHWTDSSTTPPGPTKNQKTQDRQFDHYIRHTSAAAGGANIGWSTQPNGRRSPRTKRTADQTYGQNDPWSNRGWTKQPGTSLSMLSL